MKHKATAPATEDTAAVIISSKGQLTIPAALRRELGWRHGTPVQLTVVSTSPPRVQIQPRPSVVDALAGAYRDESRPPLDLEKARADFETAAGREVLDASL